MREPAIWDKWAIYDDDGFLCGIRPDAPDDAKKAYELFMLEKENMKKSGYMPK